MKVFVIVFILMVGAQLALNHNINKKERLSYSDSTIVDSTKQLNIGDK